METRIKILIVEDDIYDIELLLYNLDKSEIKYEREIVQTEQEFTNALKYFLPHIILSDYSLPAFDGSTAFQIKVQKAPDTPFIFVSGVIGEERAIEHIKNGVTDYVLKDKLFTLPSKIKRALKEAEDKKAKKIADETLYNTNRLFAFISQINQNIVRINDEKTLFHNSCFLALKYGKFKMAWIGLFDFAHKTISVAEQSGLREETLHLFNDVPFNKPGPQQYVLQNDDYYVCNNVERDFEQEEWKAFAVKYGIRSFIVLPIKKEGSIIGTFNLSSAEPDFFDKEEIALLVEVAIDISFAVDLFEREKKHKATEELAIKNERRFRALIEKSNDVKMLSTSEGVFIYGSPAVEKVMGYLPGDFLNIPALKFFHPTEIAEFLEKRSAIADTPGASFHFQYRLLHKKGHWLWCEGTLTNLLHEPGINAFLSNFRDISDRKKAEQQLKKSELFNRSILNSLHAHIAVIDFHGNIMAVNDSWKRFAIENGNVLSTTGVGANYYDVCEKAIIADSEFALEAYQGMKEVMEEKRKDFYLEYACHSPEEQRWYGMRVIKFEGKEPLIVVSHHNISERRKAEEEILDKNLQLKNLLNIAQTIREEERTNVAREIHDELGQQLTALKMDIDWILHKQTNPEAKVASKLNEMLKMNEGIINTVRRISSDLRPAIIDDIGLVATIEWKCSDFETKTGIPCSFTSDVTERKYSKDFSIHLYRILQETLTNIARHAEATLVDISLTEKDGNELVLEIQDNGKGITQENLSSRKKLGIMGMKERAGLLKGALTITGDENKGTHVKLILSLENERTDS
ncbi:MAG: PAS domain S-box protein [Bacteroidota bacterium]